MKYSILKYLIFAPILVVLYRNCQSVNSSTNENHFLSDSLQNVRNFTYATKAKLFCKEKKYNTDFCILIDMSIHSGKKRLFLWDFQNNKVIETGLCSHGCGDTAWGKDNSKTNPIFSNKDGSHCSALGKFRIGERGVSQWGIKVKYLLHGLEESNDNALVRTIVLHSWNDVTEEDIFPKGTAEGWGCPAISNKVMTNLDEKLKTTPKPVLLWIYQ